MLKIFKHKKKGFTLIELLAVIAILAIIALITIPIITDSIEESRKSSALRSAELYINAVDNTLGTKNVNGDFYLDEGWYTINGDGDICLDARCTDKIEISAKSKPAGGKLYIKKNTVEKVKNVVYSNMFITTASNGALKIVDPDATPCTRQVDNDGFDTVTCDTETFYVMSETDDTIIMLSKYNLDAGYIATKTIVEGECYEVCDKRDCWIECDPDYEQIELAPMENTTGIQKLQTDSTDTTIYAVIPYTNPYPTGYIPSKTSYMNNNLVATPLAASCDSYAYTDFSENDYLYSYVKNYETYLKNSGVNSANARLMTFSEALDLGCRGNYCIPSVNDDGKIINTEATAEEWVYSTSYWLQSGASSCGNVRQYTIKSNGVLRMESLNSKIYGARPVIEVSKSEVD